MPAVEAGSSAEGAGARRALAADGARLCAALAGAADFLAVDDLAVPGADFEGGFLAIWSDEVLRFRAGGRLLT